MLKEQRNSRKQGDVGLSTAIMYFTRLGYTVALPLTDSQSYDLITEENGYMSRVQVKTTYQQTRYGVYKAELRTKGGNKTGTGKTKKLDSSQVDEVFILTESGWIYLIPIREIEGKSQINLGSEYEIFKMGDVPSSGL